MPTDLERFRDHARAMAQPGAHRDTCHTMRPARGSDEPDVRIHPDPACTGCVPAPDRALFARLADEVDAHMAGDTCPGCGQPRHDNDTRVLFIAETHTCTTCRDQGDRP